ncbi:MAG: ACP S-malonyltransferase [Oscillospiraceae bacterium]|nr:ACP S-malonyltransferase [Oscillospiraceae bacterium]
MGKIAFVFSGQGAQCPGMGRELYETYPTARRVFDALDGIRPGTSEQCFSGTEEELKETKNTQPCLFAVELAAAETLREAGLCGDMAAGFSLGEIAALTYAGAVSLEQGFRLVCRRGELMQRDAEARETAMAAVLKLPNEKVEELCAGFREVYPVNYNCPGQVSVSGAKEEMADFMAAVKTAGGRALPIKVKGGFHSPFMRAAAEDFGRFLEGQELREPALPLYSNRTGGVYGGDMARLLSEQICSPVRWETIVRAMAAEGADTFVELGPGKTLCGLVNKTLENVRAFAVSDRAGTEAVLAEVRS